MSESRHRREPGTLPRPLATLLALTLAGGTGVAVWLLPATAEPQQTAAPRKTMPATPSPTPTQQARMAGPKTFLTFVDTARHPGFDLAADARRSGVEWYSLGHLVAGGDGCQPRWSGGLAPGGNQVANRIGRLRAGGADAGLAFGGPDGRELAAACTRPDALLAAYRRMTGAFDPSYVDFEIHDSTDTATVRRRALAIKELQKDSPLRVGFTLPLQPTGLSDADAAMLRATREAGAGIATVDLLATLEPRTAPAGRLHRVADAVKAAQRQIARALDLGDSDAWHRIGLTSVLASSSDLNEVEAGKLAGFSDKHALAWLSLRGAQPPPAVAQLLWRAG
ncbi:hypothetical protein [Nonomuraea sediminis]|uniref:hypothetical protein n=1 Tax=Nonomuraea sediminis TaxID=2835864 RepID=UPI001BDCA328|nr:hypothetical protein [Nonomuraea sediminis]